MTIVSLLAGDFWTEWCEQLPADWTAMELRRVAEISASNVDKIPQEGEIAVRLCNYTDVYHNDVITPELEFMEATATPSEIACLRLRGGEVLLTKDSETAEDIAITAYVMPGLKDVVCGYHLYLLRPHPDKVDGRFLMRACSVSPIKDQFVTAANGITRFGLGRRDLGSSLVPVPPLPVQRKVADFLDRETAKIDRLTGEKQRLIKLLKEKRTALITQAVTEGLDPDVKMKDSGVEWLGEIPAHWRVSPLQHLTEPGRPIMYGIVLPGPHIPEGVPIVKGGDVKPGRLRLEDLSRTTFEIESRYIRSRLRGGDLVYAIRGSIGEVEKVPQELTGANLTQDAARVSVDAQVVADWLLFALRSGPAFAQLESRALGATIRGINIRDLKRVVLAVPPRSEQEAIAASLDETTRAIGNLIGEIAAGTDLLREYRTALISAAVTGKIDVRDQSA